MKNEMEKKKRKLKKNEMEKKKRKPKKRKKEKRNKRKKKKKKGKEVNGRWILYICIVNPMIVCTVIMRQIYIYIEDALHAS